MKDGEIPNNNKKRNYRI